MQVTPHVYTVHIQEDVAEFGVMHPGGSTIYFVGDPAQEMVVIDTGEHYREWTKQILDYYAELGRPKITCIVVTHGHGDHTGGLDRLQEVMNCPVRCHPKLEKRLGKILSPEVVVKLRSRELVRTGDGVSLRALFTPGHEVDHVCYYLAADKVMFTGDTILGGSTATVGDLAKYMKSLALLARFKPRQLFPAHGPLVDNGARRIQFYIRHRQEREQQILAVLEKGITDVYDIVKAVYPRNLRKRLREAAARNVRTHLTKLEKGGRVKTLAAKYTLNTS